MRELVWSLEAKLRQAAARRTRGQSLVIVAMAFIGLAAFVGLAVDGGILFISQAQLHRAVDAAAIAAATQMRVGENAPTIEAFADQFIRMNGVDPTTVTVSMWNYNNGEQPPRSTNPTDTCRNHPGNSAYDTYGLCPAAGQNWRKLIRVQASTMAKFVFMPIVGIYTTTITTNAQSEAASLDVVIVLDTSNSMGDQTNESPAHVPGSNTCNAAASTSPRPSDGSPGSNCEPLWSAKQAAKEFVASLYPNYDRVAVVSFNFKAHVWTITDTLDSTQHTGLSYYRGLVQGEHDDTPGSNDGTGIYRALDLVPLDAIGSMPAGYSGWMQALGYFNPLDSRCALTNTVNQDLTDFPNLSMPACAGSQAWGLPNANFSLVDTCTGCGLRVGSNLLKITGRPEALWLMIFLSDGGVNVGDVPLYPTDVPLDPTYNEYASDTSSVLRGGLPSASEYPNGYCGLSITATLPISFSVAGTRNLWNSPNCTTGGFTETVVSTTQVFTDTPNLHVRYCGPFNRSGIATCPPGALWATNPTTPSVPASPPYTAADYARDMADQAALSYNCPDSTSPGPNHCLAHNGVDGDPYNYREPTTNSPIVIYTIGLGDAVVYPPDYSGEELLRYIASVGDDGSRVTNPCPQYVPGVNNPLVAPGVVDPTQHARSCGNYYYAPSASALRSVFQDIAKRIFTRLTK
jgi:Flp pilus assembly protein TadG